MGDRCLSRLGNGTSLCGGNTSGILSPPKVDWKNLGGLTSSSGRTMSIEDVEKESCVSMENIYLPITLEGRGEGETV